MAVLFAFALKQLDQTVERIARLVHHLFAKGPYLSDDRIFPHHYVLYRTSSTFRTRSFAAPGRFCTPVSTSLKACDSPPCLKHSAQRGRLVKSRRSKADCISFIRSPSRISFSDCVFRSPRICSPWAS